MSIVVLQIISGILGLVALWIKQYYSKDATERRMDEQTSENIQTERKELSENNGAGIDAVCANQHDRVLQELGGSIGGRNNSSQEIDH